MFVKRACYFLGYCIDESPDDVCKIPDSQLQHITEERHGEMPFRISRALVSL